MLWKITLVSLLFTMRSSDASKIPLRPSFFRRPLLTSKVDLNLPVVKSNEFQTSQQQNNDAGEKQQHCIIKDEEIKTFGRIKYYTTFSLIENDRGDTFLDAKIYCLSIGQDLSLYRASCRICDPIDAEFKLRDDDIEKMKVLEKETLFRKLKRFSLLGTTFGSITIITIYYILILFDRYIKNDGDNEKKKEAGKNVLNNVKNQEKYTTIVL